MELTLNPNSRTHAQNCSEPFAERLRRNLKSILKALLGFNAISLIHLVRLKPVQFLGACNRAFIASFYSVHNPTTRALIQIPEIGLGEFLGDRKPVIRMSVMRYEDGMLTSDQAMALLSILVAEAPDEVLEIGTYMGHTTRQIAETLEKAIIHTVDLPEDFSVERVPEQNLPKDDFHLITRRIVGREFKGHPCASRIKQYFADTAIWNFRDAGHPTFFFIDGSHTYEYCKNDSEKCFELCGGLGLFLWHDCDDTHPGVVRFISEWKQQGRDIRRISGTSLAYWKSDRP
jgi:Methyltransferase domain